jgi:DNA-binding protein VF530
MLAATPGLGQMIFATEKNTLASPGSRGYIRLPMHADSPQNPLHGVTLEMILTRLVAHYGWAELGQIVRVNCFNVDPSISSSLKFLRKTPWARKKVETLYGFLVAGVE